MNTRLFRLDTGVWVSAPLEQVGQSVQVEPAPAATAAGEGAPGERLRVEGDVVQDRLSARRV